MSESQFIKMLQEQLKAKNEKLAEVSKKRLAIVEEESSLVRDIDALKQLLKSEKGETGSPSNEQPQGLQGQSPSSGTNVAQLVRDLINKNAGIGITMVEIKFELKKAGINVHSNYPYSLIRRLEERKAIKEANGRYYPVFSKEPG